MTAKIFQNFFCKTIVFLIIVELLSLLAYLIPEIRPIFFFFITATVAVLAIYRLKYGLYVILAELFVGSHGYLFSLQIKDGLSVSLRIALFLIVLAVWLTKLIIHWKPKSKILIYNPPLVIYPYLVLFSLITLGIINGLINNEFSSVFFDANAWVYFVLLPIFFTEIKKENLFDILQIMAGSTTWLSLKTIGILYLFSNGFAWLGDPFYRWVRDTGVGEITYISGSMFRVFIQSHIYCLIGFFIILAILITEFRFKYWKKYIFTFVYLYISSLAIIISQSRSFWIGGLATFIALVFFVCYFLKYRFKEIFLLFSFLFLILLLGTLSQQIVSGNFKESTISSRLSNLETEPAGISRLNQLKPLMYNIGQKAIFGHGFGKELTYQSNDPRILKTYPGGIYTTYAFEWGYLDIALKIGLAGLLAYLLLISQLFYQGVKGADRKASSADFFFKKLLGIAPFLSSCLPLVRFWRGRQAWPYQPQANTLLTSPIKSNINIVNSDLISSAGFFLVYGMLLGLVALTVTNIFSPYINHPLGIGYIMLVSAVIYNIKK